MIDFSNTEIAFKDKSDSELRLIKRLFTMMRSGWLVKFGMKLLEIADDLRIPLGWALKPTLYKIFVGGDSISSSEKTLERLIASNIKSVLDYASESAESEKNMLHNFEENMRIVEYTAKNSAIAFAVIKPSAMLPMDILEAKSKKVALTEKESRLYDLFISRLNQLAMRANELNVRLMIDAEYISCQGIVDTLAYELMSKYNIHRAIVFNTLQMYRKDRYEHLLQEHAKAISKGYKLGVKFVRGAYMDAERLIAKNANLPDPICDTKQDTDNNYNQAIAYSLKHVDDIEIFCGTHNVDSVINAIGIMNELGMVTNDNRFYFAQLYGMSDFLSYNLSASNYNIAKYVPYGSIHQLIPYLIRRVEENSMLQDHSQRELNVVIKELERRKSSRVSFHEDEKKLVGV